jgi:hypothetical protein
MSFYNDSSLSNPSLTEPGVKYFLTQSLKQCHAFKDKYNNMLFNICLLFGFFVILGILLLYKYKGKLTNEEKKQKEEEKRVYVLSRIKNYEQDRVRTQQELITGLPHWESDVGKNH